MIAPLPSRLGRALLCLTPTPVRKAWSELSGEAEVRREATLRAAIFAAAERNRLHRDWLAACIPPDEEFRGEIRILRARSRELARNNPYVDQFLRLLKVNVNGPSGFRLQVPGSGEAPRMIEAAWRRFLRGTVTVDRRLRGLPAFDLVIECLARDGEVFIRRFPAHPSNAFRFAIQFIDPDLVDETFNRPPSRGANEIRMGVEVNAEGAPVGYHVLPYSTWASTVTRGPRYFVPADQMDHLFVTRRPNQTRGIPWTLSAAVAARMVDKYEETEAITSRAGSAKMGILERKDEAPIALREVEDPAKAATADKPDPAKEFSANPGGLYIAPDGYEWKSWDPQHPSGNYLPFRKGQLQKVASGLGPSYAALASDLEGVSFSSIRQGTLTERDFYMATQTFIAEGFGLPLYQNWLPLAALAGELGAGFVDFAPFLEATLKGRGWPYVNPLQDVMASKEACAAGFWSRTKECAERGYDFDEIVEELRRENEIAASAGVDVSIVIDKAANTAVATNGNGDRSSKGRLRAVVARLAAGNRDDLD